MENWKEFYGRLYYGADTIKNCIEKAQRHDNLREISHLRFLTKGLRKWVQPNIPIDVQDRFNTENNLSRIGAISRIDTNSDQEKAALLKELEALLTEFVRPLMEFLWSHRKPPDYNEIMREHYSNARKSP